MIGWGEYMAWCRRRTASWLNLSLAARGAAEGIATALDKRGELSIGRLDLERAVALLLRRPLEEVAPALEELLAGARPMFVYDEARGVLVDPQHVERQQRAAEEWRAFLASAAPACPAEAPRAQAPAQAPRKATARELSTTPGAERQRARRARLRAEAARASTQLPLPVGRDADATCRADVTLSRDVTPEAVERSEIWGAPPCDASAEHAPPSLSVISSDPSTKQERSRSTVTLDPAAMVGAYAAAASKARPDLSPEEVAASWASFADAQSGKWKSEAVLLQRWCAWIRRERAGSPTPVHATPANSAPSSTATSSRRTSGSSHVFAERARWLDEAPPIETFTGHASDLLGRLERGELTTVRPSFARAS